MALLNESFKAGKRFGKVRAIRERWKPVREDLHLWRRLSFRSGWVFTVLFVGRKWLRGALMLVNTLCEDIFGLRVVCFSVIAGLG